MQWLLLLLIAAAVAGAYWYLRRQASEDPWRGMEESGEPADFDRGESLSGDSYVVGVRTLRGPAPDTPPGQTPAAQDADASWEAFTADRAADRETPEPAMQEEQAPPGPEAVRPRRAPAGDEQLFILHVASRDGAFFDGPEVHAALQAQKLKFGLNSIYHRITEVNGVPESVYAVANMLKPGFLDPVEEDHLRTPGLTLFLQLPGPIEGVTAARDLLDTSSALAEALGAQVLDDKRIRLKPQSAQYMLDQVAELDRKRRLAGSR